MKTAQLIGLFILSLSTLQAQDIKGYDVFLVAGQSNTLAGCCVKDSSELVTHPLVLQLGRYGEDSLKLIPAIDPLQHHSVYENKIGFATTFAKKYAENYLEQGRRVLLIPCGKGGTGFADNNWNPGDVLYEDAVAKTNYVLANVKNADLKGILWHQGERDIVKRNKDYDGSLDQMLQYLRKEITSAGNHTPIIVGGMVPYWVEQKKRRKDEQRLIRETTQRLPNVYYANPNKPFKIVKPDDTVDDKHYDAAGQRELGDRYFIEWNRYTESKSE